MPLLLDSTAPSRKASLPKWAKVNLMQKLPMEVVTGGIVADRSAGQLLWTPTSHDCVTRDVEVTALSVTIAMDRRSGPPLVC